MIDIALVLPYYIHMNIQGIVVRIITLSVILLLHTVPAHAAPNPPQLDRSFFDRKDVIYSSQIPSWGQIDGRFDGQYMLNYNNSCPTCPQLVRDAKIPVIRWMVWAPFSDQIDPKTNKPGAMTEEQFNNVINGIRNTLNAHPFIPLQPIAEKIFCPDTWGVDNLMKMNKNIIRVAGNRVQLYEIANEPEIDCKWAKYSTGTGGQGVKMADYWIKMVPELKRYARSLGFEIYIGGPAFFTAAVTSEMQDFLTTIRSEYNRTQNKDLIPDFVTFHIFGDTNCTVAAGKTLNDIPGSCLDSYGSQIDNVHHMITTTWAGVNPLPKLVISGSAVSVAATWPIEQINVISEKWQERFLTLMRSKNIFMANLVTMASKEGNPRDVIRKDGSTAPSYNALKRLSLTDPLAIESRNKLVKQPEGWLTGVTCEQIRGWACDPEDFNQSIGAYLYADGPTGTGKHIGSPVANNQSENSVFQYCGGAKNRTFSMPFPSSLKDGKPHTIYAYTKRLDTTKTNPQLGGSPKTITCAQSTAKQGDLNNDNRVDADDLSILVSRFGNPYTIFDFNTLTTHFGK